MRQDLDFEIFRRLLSAERSIVHQHMDQESDSLSTYSDSTPDLLDAAVKLITQDRRIEWIQFLEKRSNQIDDALRKIECGQFGVCDRCGEDIDVERLEAKPYAKYCIKCKQIIEQ